MDRSEIMAMLQEVIETYGEQETPEKTQAADQKLKIIDYMSKEKLTEDILKTKGFEKVFVLITDNSVNVTIDKQEVSRSDVAKIVDVVTRETGRGLDQITIQSKV
jgi:stage III sporulation protein AH